jgi:hypothetical protein
MHSMGAISQEGDSRVYHFTASEQSTGDYRASDGSSSHILTTIKKENVDADHPTFERESISNIPLSPEINSNIRITSNYVRPAWEEEDDNDSKDNNNKGFSCIELLPCIPSAEIGL